MATINTTAMALYVGGTKLAKCTGASLTINHSPRNTSSKDSAGWEENEEGMRSFSFEGSGWFSESPTLGLDDLDNQLINNRQTVVLRLSTEVTGSTYWEGTCYITSISVDSSSQEETVTFSISGQGTGALTKATVSA